MYIKNIKLSNICRKYCALKGMLSFRVIYSNIFFHCHPINLETIC